MRKTILVTLFILIFTLLSACSDREEFKEGIDAYDKGTYESLVDAQSFFKDYLEKNPEDSDAKNWLEKVNTSLVDASKEKIEKLYSDQNLEEAVNVANKLEKISGDDESTQEAIEKVRDAYEEQKEYDQVTSFIKDKYNSLYEMFEQWQDSMQKTVVGNKDMEYLNNTLSNIYPKVSELRKDIQQNSLSAKKDVYIEVQEDLFNYVNNLESNMSKLIMDEPDQMSKYERDLERFSPEKFNETFLKIQKSINDYVNETDNEGNKIRNIDSDFELEKVEDK